MNNNYFILRHGQTLYQTDKKDIIYPPPEKQDSIRLTEYGEEQIKKAAQKIRKENIDLIFSSDIFRTRQTAEIAAKELGVKVSFNKKLRDINFGIYCNRPKKEFFQAFPDPEQRFYKAPPKGENWQDCQKRILDFIKKIDEQYQNKKILIISHGDPLWLLQGAFAGLNHKELLENRSKKYIQTGELRVLNIKKQILSKGGKNFPKKENET